MSVASTPPAPSDRPAIGAWGQLALLAPSARWVALLAVAASFLLPFGGFGLDLCSVHRVTGLPCPGCGLTRAFISLSHGDFSTAAGLNPFALFLYPLFVALAVLALLPGGMRGRVQRWLGQRANRIGTVLKLGVFAFLGFGIARFAWFLFLGERFP